MADETPSQPANLNEEVRRIWDQKAAFWDERMGDDGNQFQRILVGPASERLLNLQPGETVLEIGCGNGVFARRMAQLGVHVIATDFSTQFLERARARSTAHSGHIEYRLLDATREDEILALGAQRFDAAVCNQAIMDISEIEPLMRGIRQAVKPGGRFVFSLSHPCFNQAGTTFSVEETTIDGEIITIHAIKTTSYLHFRPQKGVGMLGEPAPHYYFDRPLHVLFNACFQAGLVLDGLEEPAFNSAHDGSQPSNLLSWANYREIPPVLVARWRIPN
ncbi:MAG TPA: methyltransferase domain-containing protein [Ktedonobacteraceae bacterium]|jgi:2-polyprenyl-3-methyl-5-hydroxy-6-metoxy-1,4-benzoquinol methylase